MLKSLAEFVDYPIVRIVAALFGLLAVAFLGLFGALIAFTPKSNWMLIVAIGGLIGLAGWWLRIVLGATVLALVPKLRLLVLFALAIGLSSISYTILAWPDAAAWRQFLLPIAATGALLLLGTLAPVPSVRVEP